MATTTSTTLPTAPKSLFPDGLKTSGQHNPTYALLTPPSHFPKEITGPTVWRAEDYRDHPERWTHVFSASEVDELSKAADEFIASGRPLTGMMKVCVCLSRGVSFCCSLSSSRSLLVGRREADCLISTARICSRCPRLKLSSARSGGRCSMARALSSSKACRCRSGDCRNLRQRKNLSFFFPYRSESAFSRDS